MAKSKGRVLPPLHPNAGIRAAYRRRLDALIDEMQASYVYWLRATYRANPPEMANDASPAMELRRELRRLGRQWQKRFDQAAPKLAKYFATSVAERTDGALKSILKDAGMTVAFKATAAQNDALQAAVGENVALIKSHRLAAPDPRGGRGDAFCPGRAGAGHSGEGPDAGTWRHEAAGGVYRP